MPKTTKKFVHVAHEEFIQPQEYSENEFPEEFNTSQESSSEEEVVLKFKSILHCYSLRQYLRAFSKQFKGLILCFNGLSYKEKLQQATK